MGSRHQYYNMVSSVSFIFLSTFSVPLSERSFRGQPYLEMISSINRFITLSADLSATGHAPANLFWYQSPWVKVHQIYLSIRCFLTASVALWAKIIRNDNTVIKSMSSSPSDWFPSVFPWFFSLFPWFYSLSERLERRSAQKVLLPSMYSMVHA